MSRVTALMWYLAAVLGSARMVLTTLPPCLPVAPKTTMVCLAMVVVVLVVVAGVVLGVVVVDSLEGATVERGRDELLEERPNSFLIAFIWGESEVIFQLDGGNMQPRRSLMFFDA